MTRATIILFILFFVSAAAVTEIEQAQTVVQNRLELDGQSNDLQISSMSILASESGDRPLAYVFELDPIGFMITSSDDEIEPLIAYSYSSELFAEGDSRSPMIELVTMDLSVRLNSIAEAPEWYRSSNRSSWELWSRSSVQGLSATEYWPPIGSTPTGGWLEENWTQSSPYNVFCPLDLIAGSRSVAGCPAVAMGSILFFHRETNGTRFDDNDDYYHNYHEYYFIDDDHVAHDFPSWSELNVLMDTLEVHFSAGHPTSDDRAAIVYASGAACKQVYTALVSGTFGIDQAYDAYLRFGFQGCSLLDEYSDSLMQVMAQNMMDGMPAHLGIIDSIPQYGHNVVVDGYNSDDFFHINFGWGGSSNGWYSFPLSGMPYGMNIIEGIVVDIGEPMQSVEGSGAVSSTVVSMRLNGNPASESIIVTLTSDEDLSGTLQLYSIEGRLIESREMEMTSEGVDVTIPLEKLVVGAYVLRFTGGSCTDSATFLVIR